MSVTSICPRCNAKWTGLRACHCSACHQTWSGLSAFDAHQRGGECLTPREVGLVQRPDGVWAYPSTGWPLWR